MSKPQWMSVAAGAMSTGFDVNRAESAFQWFAALTATSLSGLL